ARTRRSARAVTSRSFGIHATPRARTTLQSTVSDARRPLVSERTQAETVQFVCSELASLVHAAVAVDASYASDSGARTAALLCVLSGNLTAVSDMTRMLELIS